ncbi:DUF4249 domain-containing protein [Bacteroidota bacterium]
MRVSKLLSIVIILLCTVSCIEPFHPEIKERQDKLVINGGLTDQPGMQFVEVSRSTPYNEPGFIPVRGCVVRIEDENEQGVNYSESSPGVYSVSLNETFLGINKAYKLFVYTPDGEEYQSEYDSLLACPPVDSLYYEIERQVTYNPNGFAYLGGLQFYVNVKGRAGNSRNFLWKLEETYEYHATYPLYSNLKICYKTHPITEIYTASCRYIDGTDLIRYPLNYVSGGKIRIKYGLMVRQYSLSDDAFLYWERMKTLINETGGLYEKQPASFEGNICNVNDEEEQILGFFYASQERKKWILLRKPLGPLLPATNCMPRFPPEVKCPPLSCCWTPPWCCDCRLRGGSLEPPYYWLIDE